MLSEAEWEYVACAGSRRRYHWGDGVGLGNANCFGCLEAATPQWSRPVGRFPPNRFGVHDMHGGMWEWVEDCWTPSHAGSPANGAPRSSNDCDGHVVRGGSVEDGPAEAAATFRMRLPKQESSAPLGLRVARDY